MGTHLSVDVVDVVDVSSRAGRLRRNMVLSGENG
jgi:hypothetical protein